MNTSALTSTFSLTLLLLIGLFFFIRASVKDRTQQVQLLCSEPEAAILPQIQQYFANRAYQIKEVNEEQNKVTFQGFVKPSWFLAIFLSLLASCGWLCLALVLSFLYPDYGRFFIFLVIFAPGAGIFYWRKAGRLEEVSLQWQSSPESGKQESDNITSMITVTAHRDELIQLQQALPLTQVES